MNHNKHYIRINHPNRNKNEDNSTESKETLEEIIDSKTELKKQKSSLRKKSSLVSISRKLIALTISGLLLFHARSWTKKYLNTHVLKESHNIVAPRKYRLNKKNKTIANKLLIDFPNEIPGAKKIDKYLTPNAKYCLVHIRQIHVHPKDSYYFDHFHVQRVQSNMADIMVYLLRNLKYYPLQLYNEGFVVENKDDFNKKLLDNQERVLEYQNQINKYTSSIDFFKHCSFYINSLDLLHLQSYSVL